MKYLYLYSLDFFLGVLTGKRENIRYDGAQQNDQLVSLSRVLEVLVLGVFCRTADEGLLSFVISLGMDI